MTATRRQMGETQETFLKHGPGPGQAAQQRPASSRDRSEPRTPRPALDTALLNTLQAWECFSALSIKVDLPHGERIPQTLDAAVLALLDVAQREMPALACRWAEGLYLCALNDTGADAAEQFARRFQRQLSGVRLETVTIGIATFPLLTFSQGQSLTNTCKALDHAAFFGPGSVVSFDATSLNISGDKLYNAGELEMAAAEYRLGLELNPDDANINNSLGICLARTGDLTAAQNTFEHVLDIAPAETMAVYNLGVVAMLGGDTDLALNRFQQAHAMNSEIFEIPCQIGRLLVGKGEWQAALASLEAAIALDDSHWHLFNLKGECLAQLGDRTKAIAAYSRSVKINPNNADGLSALGWLYGECNENPEICQAFFQQSIQLNPQNGLHHHRLGRWHQKNRNPDLAKEAYRQASALGYDASQEIAALEKAVTDPAAAATRCA